MTRARAKALATLDSLRAREVDRCAREAHAAAAAAEVRAAELADAGKKQQRAEGALEQARIDRAQLPADELVRAFVPHCEQCLELAVTAVEEARAALAEANELLETARRRWLRAQARRDVLTDLRRRLRTAERRGRERRVSDEANERRATTGATAWA